MDNWKELINTIMSLLVPQEVEKFLISQEYVSFSKKRLSSMKIMCLWWSQVT
jgi:hypothetical protein